MCTPLATAFTALFRLRFHLEINSFPKNSYFPLVSKQRATTTLDFEHIFCCSQFSRCSLAEFNPICSYIFVRVTFQPIDFCSVTNLPHLLQFVHSFSLQWLPIFIFHGTSAQQTFGLCQLFLTSQT
jgi:hypothetical protein